MEVHNSVSTKKIEAIRLQCFAYKPVEARSSWVIRILKTFASGLP